MPLETSTYINGLNTANPVSTDPISDGDNHLRLLKTTIKNTFPNISGAVTPTHTELNYVDGVTSAIQTQIDTKSTKASNLSDLANKPAALTNLGLTTDGSALVKAANYAAMRTLLGLGTAALTASTAYATAAQGATADAALAASQVSSNTNFAVDTTKVPTRGAVQTLVDAQGINFQSVTGARAHSTSYQNTSGKNMLIHLVTSGAGAVYIQISNDNVNWNNLGHATSGGWLYHANTFPIWNGQYWRINGVATIDRCFEAVI
jgi:hypothetical protein